MQSIFENEHISVISEDGGKLSIKHNREPALQLDLLYGPHFIMAIASNKDGTYRKVESLELLSALTVTSIK